MTLMHTDHHLSANTEIEPPPPPPGAVGTVTWNTGSSTSTLSGVEAKAFWPAESTSVRQIVLVKLPNSDEFVAFGLYPAVSHPTYCCRVPFTVWGKQSSELNAFLTKMEETGAALLEYTEVPVTAMQNRVDAIKQKSLQQAMLAAMDWALGPNNDSLSRSVA
jgi:hypothetical protein